MRYAFLPLLLTFLTTGCHRTPVDDGTESARPVPAVAQSPAPAGTQTPALAAKGELEAGNAAQEDSLSSPHQVVFADRISQGYLLLLSERDAGGLSREDLKTLVRQELADPEDETEARRLLELIDTEPMVEDPKLTGQHASPLGSPRATTEILGLYLERLPRHRGDQEVIAAAHLMDPILTRALTPTDRASLASRRELLLLRVDYRNRHAVLGLRLLQHLVELVARDRQALVHDPDTLETMGAEAFAQRRLRPSLGNVADQVVVVPFDDPRHGAGALRLTTRGMRRFGSVDLELDGLPRDPAVLQAATDLLYGLAVQMVQLGEFDRSGYAVQLPQVVTVQQSDVQRAYGRTDTSASQCRDCPGEVDLHLVERPAEAHDPVDHVVARVVAPRPQSDAPQYDHAAWVRKTLSSLFG